MYLKVAASLWWDETKQFCNYVKDIRTNDCYPTYMYYGGSKSSDDCYISNYFMNFFDYDLLILKTEGVYDYL